MYFASKEPFLGRSDACLKNYLNLYAFASSITRTSLEVNLFKKNWLFEKSSQVKLYLFKKYF